MKALQAKDKDVKLSFDLRATYSGREDYAFMEAFDWDTPSDIENHKKIIAEGLTIFENVFGYKSTSFIAPCYNWDSALEPFLAGQGINCLQGIGSQLAPTGKFDRYKSIRHNFGDRNTEGTFYNIRNVFFEPVNNPSKDWTNSAMARIQAAFLFNKPAVISTHRINFIGFIEPTNRDNGLLQLKKLLEAVVKRWPDVEFISTDQLKNYLV